MMRLVTVKCLIDDDVIGVMLVLMELMNADMHTNEYFSWIRADSAMDFLS